MTSSFYSRKHGIFLLVCSLYAVCVGDHAAPSPSHGCYRPCAWPAEPMVCNFHFRVEWFSSIATAFCGDCPHNSTDCEAENCVALNGVQRPIITVNRRVPGPSIQVCEGDVINVTVQNRLEDHQELTIHWHGIHQVGEPFMDGAPKFTQCPIPYGSSFVYTFNASQPGTHYWHAHSGAQRSDGCAGTLVVRQAPERDPHYDDYEVDDEAHVLLLQDWFDTVTLTRSIGHHLGGQSNAPDAILINGHGQRAQPHTDHDHGSPSVYTPREVLRVKPGMTHRLRLVSNAITNCPLQVSVDNHTLAVVASDGHDVRGTEVDAVVLFAGERFDVLMAADQAAGNYWLRVQGFGDCSTSYEVALVNYEGTHAHVEPPLPANATLTEGVILNPYNELQFTPFRLQVYSLQSLVGDSEGVLAEDGTGVTRYYLPLDFNSVSRYSSEESHDGHMTSDDMHMHNPGESHHDHGLVKRAHGDDEHDMHGTHGGGGAGGHVHSETTAQINHASFLVPAANLLTQYDEIDPTTFCDVTEIDPKCKTSYCECTQVLKAKLNEIIELVLVDEGFGSDQSHPMHIHGHAFRVLAQARKGDTLSLDHVKQMDQDGLIQRNLEDPPLKDTVAVPDGGYTIIRFNASNPGWWMFHCHIQFHLTNGMVLAIRVGDEEDLPPTPDDFPTCNDWPSSRARNETMGSGVDHVTPTLMLIAVSCVIFLLV